MGIAEERSNGRKNSQTWQHANYCLLWFMLNHPKHNANQFNHPEYKHSTAAASSKQASKQANKQHRQITFLRFLFPFSGALTKSQFPVFTIYAQKSCLKQRPCERAWGIDRVQGYALKGHIKRSSTAASRQECYELCFAETDFVCRWVSFSSFPFLCRRRLMIIIIKQASSETAKRLTIYLRFHRVSINYKNANL